MNIKELLIIAVGVSMDAFAIAVCKGLSVEKLKRRHLLITGLWFGGAQAVMTLLGYLLGGSFSSFIACVDHWFSFALLILIGMHMIKESREESEKLNDSFSAKAMFPLAIADSMDALAVGVTFAFQEVRILPALVMIGIATSLFSAFGLKIGNRFGARYRSKAEFAGGLILILMGFCVLLEDLGGLY